MRTVLLTILPLLLLAGCNGIAEPYVAADRANYEATAPMLEDVFDNARRTHGATSVLTNDDRALLRQVDALLDAAEDTEDAAEANSLRLEALNLLQGAVTAPWLSDDDAQIWRDGLETWRYRIEQAERQD